MTGYIYQIHNIVNDKCYIGQTVHPEAREKRHFSNLRCQRHDNTHLQHAFNEYGEDSFEFSILEAFEFERQEEIDAKEIHWIEVKDTYKNGYNCNPGG